MRRDIQGPELQVDDIVNWSGQYAWQGRIMHLTMIYAMVMDADGRLARMQREKGRFILLGRTGDVDPTVAHLARETNGLRFLREVRDALAIGQRVEPDPADFDRWMMPLASFARDVKLTIVSERYYGWSAHLRRRFEAALKMIEGPRQREVFLRTVMGDCTTTELRDQYNLRNAAIRTARWRAINAVNDNMPNVLKIESR